MSHIPYYGEDWPEQPRQPPEERPDAMALLRALVEAPHKPPPGRFRL